jgi:predicted permease
VPLWKWGVVKLAVGLVVIWLPVLSLLLFMRGLELASPWVGFDLEGMFPNNPNGLSGFYLMVLAWVLCVATSIYLWSAAAGVNRSDEIRAAALAVIVMLGCWGVMAIPIRLSTFGQDVFPEKWMLSLLVLAPGGVFPGMSLVANSNRAEWMFLPLLLIPTAVLHSALAARFVLRFGRAIQNADRSQPVSVAHGRQDQAIKRPLKSPLTAIVWAQLRELGPLAALCPVVTLGIALVFAMLDTSNGQAFADRLVGSLGPVLAMIGILFTTVLGAGVFLRDVEPGLNTFWRSRPIRPNFWFWTKYLTGFGLWMIALGIPATLFLLLNLDRMDELRDSWQVVLYLLSASVAIFASSVATTCLVRQPVYACLLSLGTVLILFGTVASKIHDEEIALAVVAVLMGLVTIVSTLLAWLSVRYDWGWQPSD